MMSSIKLVTLSASYLHARTCTHVCGVALTLCGVVGSKKLYLLSTLITLYDDPA